MTRFAGRRSEPTSTTEAPVTDTTDKLSPDSLKAVGDTIVTALPKLVAVVKKP